MHHLLDAYIYEIKKGTKPLVLMTVPHSLCEKFCEKIIKNKLDLCVQNIGEKDNIFFGKSACVQIISTFIGKKLCDLSAEEDFILGIMLGYSRTEQCIRYLNKKKLCPCG